MKRKALSHEKIIQKLVKVDEEVENLSDDEMETRMIKIFVRAEANHETKKLQDFMNTFANKNAPHRDMYRYTMFNFSEYIV